MLSLKKKFIILFTNLIALMLYQSVSASHIAAGEITARRVDCFNNTYEFTLRGFEYLLTKQVDFGNGFIDFGDGDTLQLSPGMFTRATINERIDMMVFTVRHTYSGNQTFRVSYQEDYRNPDIRNISGSGNVAFYVETLVRLDPFLGCNSSPVFSIPPIDQGGIGISFVHNPGAFDPDGDSLAYRIVTPQSTFGVNVPGYQLPHRVGPNPVNETNTGPATFELDAITGDMIWNAPTYQGNYNVAFIVEEWRNLNGDWFLMGYVMRDMQIFVEETDNNPPEIEAPEFICIEAGELLLEQVSASDPDGDEVKIEAFGEPFTVNPAAAFSNDPPVFHPSPDVQEFSWATSCELVRDDPYIFRFKVTDDAPVGFARFASTAVQVVAPAPQNLQAAGQPGRSIQLSWDSYECSNASSMQIWRRVDSFDFTPDECEVGIPPNAGYELVANVAINNTGYLDNNGGLGLNFGANYCYRLVAEFPLPRGGKSYASQEVCFQIDATGPIITNVDVLETDEDNGEILLRWQQPYEIDEVTYPGPYSYRLYRATGLTVGEPSQLVTTTTDTVYIDTGLNTVSDAYRYMVEIFDANSNPANDPPVEKSSRASSVWFDPASRLMSVELRWNANVPWSNVSQDYPYHYIYRDRVNGFPDGQLVLIDSVDVTQSGFSYLDQGQFNGQTLSDQLIYRYYVETSGTYGNPLIDAPLLNKSQIVGVQPSDTVPPCPPISFAFDDFETGDECEVFMANRSCDFNDFENPLSWIIDEDPACTQETRLFEVYYSATGEEGDFELIATTESTSYVHRGLSSFKGCYRIAAVDRSGNVSSFSETICKDNCPNIIFPNVFTPNGDGKNDVFAPFNDREFRNTGGGNGSEGGETPGQPQFTFDYNNCPRFVLDVELRVFSRWGNLVYRYDSFTAPERSIYVNWDGTNQEGKPLSAGTYYYEAVVTFDVLNPLDNKRTYKGWVQLQR